LFDGVGAAWFRDFIGLAVLELRESGDLQKLHKRWWYDKGECAPENDGKVWAFHPESRYLLIHCVCLAQWRTSGQRQRRCYSPEGEYCKYSMSQKNGLHAIGYNSAENEPIWMKFVTL